METLFLAIAGILELCFIFALIGAGPVGWVFLFILYGGRR